MPSEFFPLLTLLSLSSAILFLAVYASLSASFLASQPTSFRSHAPVVVSSGDEGSQGQGGSERGGEKKRNGRRMARTTTTTVSRRRPSRVFVVSFALLAPSLPLNSTRARLFLSFWLPREETKQMKRGKKSERERRKSCFFLPFRVSVIVVFLFFSISFLSFRARYLPFARIECPRQGTEALGIDGFFASSAF